jgi:hypothetical protein
MSTDRDEAERSGEESEQDAGLIGGGGVAKTVEGDAEDALDEHGERLSGAEADSEDR